MPTEPPTFFSTPILPATSRPTRRRKSQPPTDSDTPAAAPAPTTTDSSPTPAPKPTRPSHKRRARIIPPKDNGATISASLSTIYRDAAGALPDMKTITIKTPSPVWRVIKIGFGLALLALLLSALGWWWLAAPSRSRAEVALAFEGPAELPFGATSTILLRLTNHGSAPLQAPLLRLQYPSGFIPATSSLPATNAALTEWLLPNLAAKSSRELTLTGHLFSAPGVPGSLRATLSYRPANFQSNLPAAAVFTVTAFGSPLTISVSGPDQLTLGSAAAYTFKITGDPATPATLFELVPLWSPGFTVSSSTPPLTKRRWLLTFPPTLAQSPGPLTRSFILQGLWENTTSSSGVMRGTLLFTPPGTRTAVEVTAATVTTSLTKRDVALTLAINGTTSDFAAAPGDTLALTLNLKNNSPDAWRQGLLKLTFDASALGRDSALYWNGLEDKADGSVVGEQLDKNLRRGTITWTSREAAGLKALAPGEELTLDVRLPIRNAKQFAWDSLKGKPVIKVAAAFSGRSPRGEETVNSPPIEISLHSDLKLDVRHAPPGNPGEPHQFTWVLTNSLHPLKQVEVSAMAFGPVVFAAATSAPAGVASFDPKTQTLRWSIPEWPASLDVLAWPFTLALTQTNPTQTALVSKVKVTALDTVTGETFEVFGEATPLPASP